MLLDNNWFGWLVANYSTLLFIVIPSAIVFILKLWAIRNPNVPTNKIIDLLKQLLAGKIME